jgi:hypothetical protein
MAMATPSPSRTATTTVTRYVTVARGILKCLRLCNMDDADAVHFMKVHHLKRSADLALLNPERTPELVQRHNRTTPGRALGAVVEAKLTALLSIARDVEGLGRKFSSDDVDEESIECRSRTRRACAAQTPTQTPALEQNTLHDTTRAQAEDQRAWDPTRGSMPNGAPRGKGAVPDDQVHVARAILISHGLSGEAASALICLHDANPTRTPLQVIREFNRTQPYAHIDDNTARRIHATTIRVWGRHKPTSAASTRGGNRASTYCAHYASSEDHQGGDWNS